MKKFNVHCFLLNIKPSVSPCLSLALSCLYLQVGSFSHVGGLTVELAGTAPMLVKDRGGHLIPTEFFNQF